MVVQYPSASSFVVTSRGTEVAEQLTDAEVASLTGLVDESQAALGRPAPPARDHRCRGPATPRPRDEGRRHSLLESADDEAAVLTRDFLARHVPQAA